jgi:hypothetical protein
MHARVTFALLRGTIDGNVIRTRIARRERGAFP